jgi:hypothetical protein
LRVSPHVLLEVLLEIVHVLLISKLVLTNHETLPVGRTKFLVKLAELLNISLLLLILELHLTSSSLQLVSLQKELLLLILDSRGLIGLSDQVKLAVITYLILFSLLVQKILQLVNSSLLYCASSLELLAKLPPKHRVLLAHNTRRLLILMEQKIKMAGSWEKPKNISSYLQILASEPESTFAGSVS